MIRANDPILQLRGRPIDADCRILSEENYQRAVVGLRHVVALENLQDNVRRLERELRSAFLKYSPQSFGFAQAPPDPVCGTCKGTGEIVEFPADEDERLVGCPACGGTGEGIRP